MIVKVCLYRMITYRIYSHRQWNRSSAADDDSQERDI